MALRTALECNEIAADCERLAERAPTAEIRAMFLKIASQWIRLGNSTVAARPLSSESSAATTERSSEPLPARPSPATGASRSPSKD